MGGKTWNMGIAAMRTIFSVSEMLLLFARCGFAQCGFIYAAEEYCDGWDVASIYRVAVRLLMRRMKMMVMMMMMMMMMMLMMMRVTMSEILLRFAGCVVADVLTIN